MPLFVFGVNHRTAPVAIRERVAFSPEQLESAIAELVQCKTVDEAVILSTCNRTEIYCNLDCTDGEMPIEWLLGHHNLAPHELEPYLFRHADEEAVRHLLRVASGLDSMVLGEPQILGQLKNAYGTALKIGSIGKVLNRLFQHSFSVAKQIRTETAIGSSPVSVAFSAVKLAQQIFADLDQHTALLIGAGNTIELVANHLHENRIGRLIIANRSIEKSQAISDGFGAYAISLKDMPMHLTEADIIISATASQLPILGKGAVERALKERRHKPMFMVDIAVPRDIEPEIGQLEDVYLYTVDDLETVIEENLRSRQMAALQADDIVATGTRHFSNWQKSLGSVGIIRALRQKAEQSRAEAVDRARKRLASGEDPEAVLETLAYTITNKFTHAPSVKLREASTEDRSEFLKAAQELFELGEDSD